MFSKFGFLSTLLLLALAASACASVPNLWGAAGTPSPTPLPSSTQTEPPTLTPTSSPTSTSTPTLLPSLTPSITPTPPQLPGPYLSPHLFDDDTPHTYVTDPCQYLRDRWTSTHAAPGTVAMVIMFHAVGGETYGDRISDAGFQALMQALHAKSFEAITTAQLADFMESNTWIPPRSVLLVADDRRNRAYFDTFFRPFWEDFGWPVVNAWLNPDDSITWEALPGNVELEEEGWVDHQAHGILHNIPMGPDSSDEYILSELQGSIDAFQQYYHKTPTAIIWPGGGFAERPVEVARQLGYRLGFTINPRGPLMYNWVPLADVPTPIRPTWLAEGGMNDPLLVLPRYWSTDAIIHLDEVIQVGEEAAALAQANRAVELEYYEIVCSASLGPIP